MTQPKIDFVPLCDAVPRGEPCTLDVLVRVQSPELDQPRAMPPLNLSIVLDRSGSMAGEKLDFAKAAARQAVALLGAKDRLHLVSFGDEVDTVATGAGPEDHDALMLAIDWLVADGSTALHGGWARGVSLLRGPCEPGAISRVLLASDGQANRGERRPEVIAHQVQRESAEGISTSALGVGRDFNEDLLEAMARAGDGEYHFVETPAQLPAIFEAELRSLTRTYGRRCSLGFTAADGVRITDVLNDLDRTSTGRMKLPNLVHGRGLEVLVRLELSPTEAERRELFQLRLAWNEVDSGLRRKVSADLSLPAIEPRACQTLPANPAVREQVLLLEAARIKQLAVAALDIGDLHRTRVLLEGALQQIRQGPQSAALGHEQDQLRLLLRELDGQDVVSTRKHSKAQTYNRQRSRPDSDLKH